MAQAESQLTDMPSALNYEPATQRRSLHGRLRAWPWKKIAAGAAILLAIDLIPTRDSGRRETDIDRVTGSIRSRTIYFGITVAQISRPTPFEQTLRNSGISWTPQWQPVGTTGLTLLGRVTYRECTTAPPVLSPSGMIELFVQSATPAEIRAFATTMDSGTDAQRTAALQAMEIRVFGVQP